MAAIQQTEGAHGSQGSSASYSQENRPYLWPSLVIAAILAATFSYKWLTRGPHQLFDFRLLLFPVVAPLAFGVIWPALIGLQALVFPSHRQAHLWRYRLAIPLFVLCCAGLSPFVLGEIRHEKQLQEEAEREEQGRKLRNAEVDQARAALEMRGILAFTEPLQGQQAGALDRYIYEKHITPEDFVAASRRYHTPMIMKDLAQKSSCPPEALTILFANAVRQEDSLSEATPSPGLQYVFSSIGHNLNTPADVLVKMIGSKNSIERTSVLKNPNLPLAAKLAYLKKGCQVEEASEFELRVIAADLDTPVEVLKCLSEKPSAAYAVAFNPHTPTSTLRTMSESSNYWVQTGGIKGLAKRQTTPQ